MRWPGWARTIKPGWLVALAALALAAGKLIWVEDASRSILGCAWCASHKAALHELQWLLALWAMHLAAGTRMAAALHPAAPMLRLLVIGLLLLAAADLVVLHQFLQRLTLGEAMKFIGEPQAVRGFVGQLGLQAATLAGLVAVAAVLLAVWYTARGRAKPAHHLAWLVPAVLAAVAAVATVDDQHTPYLQHSAQAFLASQSRHRAYSPQFAASLAARASAALPAGLPTRPQPASPSPSPSQRCVAGAAVRPDVILLMVESLSVYQSRHFNGIHDWTPELDRLSAAATSLKNFHANGVTSEQGLIALLTGEPPIERAGAPGRTLFDAFMTPQDSLPKLLRGAGYSTAFISGFNLDFPGLQPWLAAVGFERIEGQEAPYFAGRAPVRYHFDSVPDELLLERVLHEVSQARDKPLFVTTFTQSTHHPYIDPSSGQRTQQAAFGYVDRALGRFVDALRAQRYFDNGMLLIVSDHRAMQPMDSRERGRFGDRGFARIPMTVIGPDAGAAAAKPVAVPEGFSQTDVLPSLRQLVSRGPVCAAADQGLFLRQPRVAPECIYTRRAYNPNRVYAHCGQTDAVVELDGDDTRVSGSSALHRKVLETVNRLRLGQGFDQGVGKRRDATGQSVNPLCEGC